MPRLALFVLVAQLPSEILDLGRLVFVAYLVEGRREHVHHGPPVGDAPIEVVDCIVHERLARLQVLLGLLDALASLVDVFLDLLDVWFDCSIGHTNNALVWVALMFSW